MNFLLDTMVLINLLERCQSVDLCADFFVAELRFSIVKEVEKEFRDGMNAVGKIRLDKYMQNGLISIVSPSDIEIDPLSAKELAGVGFGLGELFSSFYLLHHRDMTFISDEKRVKQVLKRSFRIDVKGTYDLLKMLVGNGIRSQKEIDTFFDEMIRNGLWISR